MSLPKGAGRRYRSAMSLRSCLIPLASAFRGLSLGRFKLLFRPTQRFLRCGQFLLQLLFAKLGQESAHGGSRFHAKREEIVSRKQWGMDLGLILKLLLLGD